MTFFLILLYSFQLKRKKLEPQNENNPSSRVDALDEVIRDVRPPEVDTSGFQLEVSPWTESFEISTTDVDGMSLFSFCCDMICRCLEIKI